MNNIIGVVFHIIHGSFVDGPGVRNPPPLFFQPKIDGSLFGRTLDPDKMKKAKRYYYTIMGWDENGVPLPEKIKELAIQW